MHFPVLVNIRILIADENLLTRSGIKALLTHDKSMLLVYETDNSKDLMTLIQQHHPDVMLITHTLLINFSSELQALISRFPFLKIVALSPTKETSYITQAAYPGLPGHLVKEMEYDELTIAIKTVHEGGIYYSKASYLKKMSPVKVSLHESLSFTNVEIRVLELCCKEMTSKEIAVALQLAPKTVEHYKEKMMRRTGCKSSTGLAVYALVNNLVSKDQIASIIASNAL